MSLGIYPVFNPRLNITSEAVGELLAESFDTLDQLADQHGLTRFTAFADTRPIPPDFRGTPEELEQRLGPWNDWFPCRSGIATFESLAQLISDHDDAAQQFEEPAAVAEELRAMVRALIPAAARGARFRLEMS